MPYVLPEKQKAAQKAWYLKKRKKPDDIRMGFRFKRNIVTWEELNSLDAKKFGTWKECVEECRKSIGTTMTNKVYVAQLAEQACTVRRGGDFRSESFLNGDYGITIKAFAEEIKVHQKTLSSWIAINQLVIKNLPEGTETVDYSAAQLALKVMGRHCDPKKMVQRYQELCDPMHPRRTIDYFFKNLKAAINNLSQGAAEHFNSTERQAAEELAKALLSTIRHPKTTKPFIGLGTDMRHAKRTKRI